MPVIWPRRRFRSPITSPEYSSGVTTSTFMIGSSSTGLARLKPSLKPIEPAILNAISFESTSWYEPSNSVTFTSTTGYPAMTPVSTASLMPLSTAGTYSRGTLPPTTPLMNSYPLPCSLGSNFSHTCPYCPRPPHGFVVGLGFRLHRHRDDRRGKLHFLERDDLVEVAQRVAGDDVLQSHRGRDVASAHFLDLGALAGMHLQQAPDALFLALGGHVHRVARIENPGVDAEERQVADERV